MMRKLSVIILLTLSSSLQALSWFAPLRSAMACRISFYRRLGPYMAGLGIAGFCPKLPTIEPEQSPAPLKGTFSIWGKGHIRCDAQDTHCNEQLKLWQHHGAQFGRCLIKDFNRTPEQPRTQECQSVFKTLGVFLPEPNDRKLPVTGIRKAQWTSDYNQESHTGRFAFNIKGDVRCKDGDLQCNNALYLLSKTSHDFSRCTREHLNSSTPTQDPVCYSLFNLLEKSGPDVATLKHIPAHYDAFDVHIKAYPSIQFARQITQDERN